MGIMGTGGDSSKRSYTLKPNMFFSPKIHADLVAGGYSCSVNRVARLMKEAAIESKLSRKFGITTDSRNTLKPKPDLLRRQFTVNSPDKAWVSDTTFIGTREGWLYLAVVMDLFSRKIIGWAMGNRNDTKLVKNALSMAIQRRNKPVDVIIHSDQGSTYASGEYQKLIQGSQMKCSMSRKGECLDNAVAESFFGTIKNELIHFADYRSRSQAKHSIFEYIEVFYNRNRRHAFLSYLAPAEFEEKHACI